ncbi:hypothetical protein At1g04090-like [Actinidia eriantha]|uniref:hypothetical protein At1g04090-like n=1 Tax=Actinidia eriantha TaxID=165200 RepID=UPI00258D4F7F|nr:hypothetical protein At1g04090-like [Actinidia eriantha]
MVNLLSSCCSKNTKPLPIENLFKLPSPIPTWHPGGGFGRGTIDLGGLQVRQVSTFTKVWASCTGGPNNSGATFFEPSQIGDGFHMLGCYAQPNNKPLFGWVLVGKNAMNSRHTLSTPIRYECIWSSESLRTKENSNAYIWLPIPPPNYKAIGYVVTNSPESPPLNKIRCVRSDFTENCEQHSWIWGLKKKNNRKDPKEFGIYSLRPTNRGKKALGVSTGTFLVQNSGDATLPLACLKNAHHLSYMPDLDQIEELIKAYSPIIYFHPNDKHLPSSVSWFFEKGVRLYREGDKSNLVQVEPTGSNLPQDDSDEDSGGGGSWLALPVDGAAKKLVKMGNLQEAKVYLHIKPMLGGTFTDIVMWLFYPFNGPGKVRVSRLIKIPYAYLGDMLVIGNM